MRQLATEFGSKRRLRRVPFGLSRSLVFLLGRNPENSALFIVVVLVVSFPWWCGGTSSLPGSSSFSSSNVVVIVLNVSKTQIYRWRAKRRSCVCTSHYCKGKTVYSRRVAWYALSLHP